MKLSAAFVSIYVFMLGLSHVNQVYAADFNLSIDAIYTVANDGRTDVTKHIRLTNLSTNVYPEAYFLELPGDAQDVVAFDRKGKIPADVVLQDGVSKARVRFNQESLGLHSETEISISYSTVSIAKQIDEQWSITIPAAASSAEVTAYTTTLTFPETWGTPSSIVPPYDQPYVWTLQETSNTPINVSFAPKPTDIPIVQQTSITPLFPYGIGFGLILLAILYLLSKRLHRT